MGLGLLAVLVAFAVWRYVLGAPAFLFVLRLYKDHAFPHEQLRALGWLAPVAFILLQASQVVISPIPGEATGFLGGYLFGLTLGFVYSNIGLTLGTMAAFWIGRWLGAPVVARYVTNHVARPFGFIVGAEGAILAFVIYLIPGFRRTSSRTVRDQSHAGLGLRAGFHPGPEAGHLVPVGPGRGRRRGSMSSWRASSR